MCMLAWHRNVCMNTGLNKYFVVVMELRKCVLNFTECVTCNGIALYQITEVHECCKAFDYF